MGFVAVSVEIEVEEAHLFTPDAQDLFGICVFDFGLDIGALAAASASSAAKCCPVAWVGAVVKETGITVSFSFSEAA